MDSFVTRILGAIRFPTPKTASKSAEPPPAPEPGTLGWTSQTSEPIEARKDS